MSEQVNSAIIMINIVHNEYRIILIIKYSYVINTAEILKTLNSIFPALKKALSILV